MANHLSRLTIAQDSHSSPINDEFLEESLLLYIASYLATGEFPIDWKAKNKQYFFAKIHSYYWEEPFLFKYCADQIIKRCVLKRNNKGFSATSMKMLVEVILLHKRQL